MADGKVNLFFRAIADGSGFTDTIRNSIRLKGEVDDLSAAVKKLGGVAGATVTTTFYNQPYGNLHG